MEKNILSIDFDYIMYPCLNIYNSYSTESIRPEENWSKIESDMNIKDFLTYDSKAYISIVKMVKKAVEGGAKLVSLESHADIVDDLKNDKDFYNNIDNKYNIINIDFHHDICYNKHDISNMKRFDKYTCADWLGYLSIHDKLNKSIWLKAPNSQFPDPELIKLTNSNLEIRSRFELDDIYDSFDKYDTVYLVLSPNWVPYKFKHLYDLITELFGGN